MKIKPPLPMSDADLAVVTMMAEYPLERGQMLLLGPLSCAYLSGDYDKAPWLVDIDAPEHIKIRRAPPNGKRLPDLHKLERHEWTTTPPRTDVRQTRNARPPSDAPHPARPARSRR